MPQHRRAHLKHMIRLVEPFEKLEISPPPNPQTMEEVSTLLLNSVEHNPQPGKQCTISHLEAEGPAWTTWRCSSGQRGRY